jgi:signal transduction histidine kinase/HAMP domain-containing protein/AmiR/NasT family two-component response regulator
MIRHLLRRSLSARLTSAFLTLSVGTVVLATYVSYRESEAALRSRLEERLDIFAEEDASELAHWLQRHRSTVSFLANLPTTLSAVTRRDTAMLGNVLAGLDAEAFSATELLLLEVPGGRVLYSTREANIGTFGVTQLFYVEGREELFTQPIYPSGDGGAPTLTVAAPVKDANGRTRAVLAAHLDLREMELALAKRPGAVPIDAYLVNQFAEFVSADRFGAAEHRRGVRSDAINAALEGRSGVGLYDDYAGNPVVGAWRWLPDYRLALILEAPQDRAFAPARRLLWISLVVGLVAALTLTLGIVVITRRLTRPIVAITRAAEQVAGGQFSVEAPVEGKDELAMLATAFNAMTVRLRTLYGELGAQVAATREALTQAQASRALLQDVVDNTTTLVLVIGHDFAVRLANARVAALAGLPPERLLGARLADLPGTIGMSIAALVREVRDVRAPAERELELGDGHETHTWQAVAFPLTLADGTPYAVGVVATDLTERARLEADRRERDASVQQAQKLESLGIMAGGIAHDFNNILGAILGNVDLAQTMLDDPAEVNDALEQIAAASRRASELTRQMLAYAGRASLRREVLDLRAVLTDIVPLVRAGQPKKIEFLVQQMVEPLWVEADPAQISQVALNLLTNAAEAIGSEAGRVTLLASHVEAPPLSDHERPPEHTGAWIRISVEDTGSGLTDEVRTRMFDPFFSTKSSGRGLGLSAVRGIIRSTGGILRIESATGRGTRFDVYLPAAAAPAATTEPPSITPTGRRAGTVLVVDDEEVLRRISRRTLELAGLKVIDAPDGAEGLARFKEFADVISLVVLDITMPGMGGIELLGEIRKLKPDLPAIIASGYDRADDLSSTTPDHWTRFLQKPFGIHTLREISLDLIARSREARDARNEVGAA